MSGTYGINGVRLGRRRMTARGGIERGGPMTRAFSAQYGFGGREPRALPWAGMNDAFGVSQRPRRFGPNVAPKHSVLRPAVLWVRFSH